MKPTFLLLYYDVMSLRLKRRFGFNSRSGKTKNYKKLVIQSFSPYRSAVKRDNANPLPHAIDRWTGDSLIRRPQGSFAVFWQRQTGE